MRTMHEHTYSTVWRCEHPEVEHGGECSRGRWIDVCSCGEAGYRVADHLLVTAFTHAALAWGILLGLLALIAFLFPESRP